MPPADTASLRILHLEDDPLDHALVARQLAQCGLAHQIQQIESLTAFEAALDRQACDLVLADYRMAGFTALDAWAVLRRRAQALPFILISGAIGESAAVAAIQQGISDYLPKDELSKLHHVIQRALEVHRIVQEKARADAELAASEQRMAHFAEHLQDTIEQERAAIAREIHDDIGGSLAAIRFDLAWLERHADRDEQRAHARSATLMLQHAIEASQRIMRNLRPAVLDQGLVAAVRWLADAFAQRAGVAVQLQAPAQLAALPKAVELAAYRTTQEALTNIGKYAQCTRVQIDLSDAEGVLTLEVTDNGQGLEPQALAKSQSFGIRGLKERARTVGGWLDVSSTTGRGTSVILSVPLHCGASSRSEVFE
jgi:signal transduction histidine kinase